MTTAKIGTMLRITGQVVRTHPVHPELVSGTFMCLDCRTVMKDVEQQFKYTQVWTIWPTMIWKWVYDGYRLLNLSVFISCSTNQRQWCDMLKNVTTFSVCAKALVSNTRTYHLTMFSVGFSVYVWTFMSKAFFFDSELFSLSQILRSILKLFRLNRSETVSITSCFKLLKYYLN